MSSRAGSTIVTFLMSIPVAALGLMAVFGVPPLSNVIAAPRGFDAFDSGDDGRRSRRPGNSSTDDWGASEAGVSEDSFGEEAPDWDAPSDSDLASKNDENTDGLGFRTRNSDRNDSPLTQRDESRRTDPWKTEHADDAPEARPPARNRLLPKMALSDPGLNSQERSAAAPTSMKEALKKLNMLEVKTYNLRPGVEPDTWLFVCLFAPGDDSRIVRRFEAEAADPEEAVGEVLQQIDSWLAQRWKDKQPVARNAR